MAVYPRVQPESDIRCERGIKCEVVAFRTPGKRPLAIECSARRCDHRGFVRGDEQGEVEAAWAERLAMQKEPAQ